MITVEQHNVGRIALANLADGPTAIVEGIDYVASCGCTFVVGARLDNRETTGEYCACEQHLPLAAEFVSLFIGPEAPEIATSVWMATLLNQLLEPDPQR